MKDFGRLWTRLRTSSNSTISTRAENLRGLCGSLMLRRTGPYAVDRRLSRICHERLPDERGGKNSILRLKFDANAQACTGFSAWAPTLDRALSMKQLPMES